MNKIVDTCRALVEPWRGRAARHDADGKWPAANMRDLARTGLLGLVVPKSAGGLGAGFAGYTRALAELARGDASTALNFAQHNIPLGALAEMDARSLKGPAGRDLARRRSRVFEEVVRRRKIIAAATSEPGVGFRPSRVRTTYRASGRGFRLDGEKNFVSMAGHADYYFLAARDALAPAGEPRVSYFLVPARTRGLEVRADWDALGMRATESHSLLLRGCTVGRDALFGGIEGAALHHLVRRPHWAVGAFTPVYLGIADSAVEHAAAHLAPRSADPVIRRELGTLAAERDAARALVFAAADDPRDRAAVYRAKHVACEAAASIASRALALCGGAALRRGHPLERAFRDARSGSVMGANAAACLDVSGRAAFGADLDSIENSPW